MQVTRYPDVTAPARERSGAVVTIGAYDGVHVGHKAVIGEVRRLASERGCASAVVTFDRHPASVVRPSSAPKLLTDLAQKLELLAATGLDETMVVRFDEERSREGAEEFVAEVLGRRLGACAVVVGEDFHFGRQRAGNVELLRKLGPDLGFEVVGLPLLAAPGTDGPVSSTTIRHALLAGDLELAARLLGRAHEVRGTVADGDGRGHDLGFPTANVTVATDILLPAEGIYAGWYGRGAAGAHPSAISVGRRPTFHEDGPAVLEAYLIDFDGDLYGEEARVQFVRRLRSEARFDSVDDLVVQMARDVEETRAVLAPR